MIDYLVHYFLVICYYLLLIYYLLIAIYYILGWFPDLREKKIYFLLEKITDPYVKLFRNKIVSGGIDWGSTIGLVIYSIALRLLARLI